MLDYKNKNALRTPVVIIPHQAPGTPNTITHGLHPLPDGFRYRIASGLSVQRLPPVAITPLLILRVTVLAD
jgi:hypothetical protein